MNVITITDLLKTYGDNVVLDIKTMSFEECKIYALVGKNGSGKSTLLKILAGIIKPDSGKISFNEKSISYMPQTSIGFSMSVLNNVLLSYPVSERKNKKNEALKIIENVGLTPLIKKNGAHLSGGETQKLALARILPSRKKILLLDEPTASMDNPTTETVEKILKSYVKDNNATIIIATHSKEQAENLADFTIIME